MSETNEIYAVAEKVAMAEKVSKSLADATIQTEGLSHFPLQNAYLCGNCDNVTNNAHACPACAGTNLMSLAKVLNR